MTRTRLDSISIVLDMTLSKTNVLFMPNNRAPCPAFPQLPVGVITLGSSGVKACVPHQQGSFRPHTFFNALPPIHLLVTAPLGHTER